MEATQSLTLTSAQTREEWLKCSASCTYFVYNYCKIYDASAGDWIPFVLWPAQVAVLEELQNNRLNVILKARQLGMTWLVLCFVLWKMIYRPVFTALLFSRRETEAIYLLGQQRLRGIYAHLPKWMRSRQIVTDASHEWILSNGSVAYGFPTTAGDSYTAGFAFVDEADLVPNLNQLMNAVKPTIDGGGGMTLLSRVDKSTPNSEFKRIYRGARAHENGWNAIFLPWNCRPGRDAEWYEMQSKDILSRTGSLDDLYQQYPATDEEALMPPMLDRRIPFSWLAKCTDLIPKIDNPKLSLPMLRVYREPSYMQEYIIGVDPAEGNPHSDDSVAIVLNLNTLEQCAVLSGKVEPEVLTGYVTSLSNWYNSAKVLTERNNHGHVVIAVLNDDPTMRSRIMKGIDGNFGWVSSSRGKALMYDALVEELRNSAVIIHDEETKTQLANIEGTTLKAPEGDPDDLAVAFALAVVGAVTKPALSFSYPYVEQRKEYGKRRRPRLPGSTLGI